MAGTDTKEYIAALLQDDVASDETLANIASALNTLNNVSALAACMKMMGATLVELRCPHIQTATAKRDSRAVDLTNKTAKRQQTDAVTDSLTQDADLAIQALLNSDETQPQLDNEDGELLQALAIEYSSQDKTSSPIYRLS